MTGVWVGALLPPLGSGVTSSVSSPCSLPTLTSLSPLDVTLNRTPVGIGFWVPRVSHTS